ncbi:hypothetical protein BJ944DRAFT_198221 [Cunninghamella echinulata]|nr:hypothetical protein BJ944DRAFT_198221 [Cunninghamella echinulata]
MMKDSYALENKDDRVFFNGTFKTIPLEIIEIEVLSHNVKRFRIGLPEPNQIAGFAPTSFLAIKYSTFSLKSPFGYLIRRYTPISLSTTEGYFDIIIKRYDRKSISEYIHTLKPGDTLPFLKKAMRTSQYKPNHVKTIGLIAGGVGLAPMYQLIVHILNNPNDHTNIELLYCNSTKQDILLLDQLNQFHEKYPERIKVTYCLSQQKEDIDGFFYEKGRITKKMIQDHLSNAEKFYVCGPSGLLEAVVGKRVFFGLFGQGYLRELGYTSKQIVRY